MFEKSPYQHQSGPDFLWLEDGLENYKKSPLDTEPENNPDFGYIEALRKAVSEIKSADPDPEYLAALERGRTFMDDNVTRLSNEPLPTTEELRFEEISEEFIINPPDVIAEKIIIDPRDAEAYLETIEEASRLMDIAVAKEHAEGIEAANQDYEAALRALIQVTTHMPGKMPDPGYNFELALARCQSRLGVSESTETYKSSSYQHPETKNHDRKADMRERTIRSIGIAFAKAGGKEAPLDVAAMIMTQRSEAYRLFAAYDERHGNVSLAELDLRESVLDIKTAEYLAHQTDELRIVPTLPEIIEEQVRELEAVGVL